MIIEQIKKFAANRNSSFPGFYSTLLIGPWGMTINFMLKCYKVFFSSGILILSHFKQFSVPGPRRSLTQPSSLPVYWARSFTNKGSFTLGMREMPKESGVFNFLFFQNISSIY